jgi:hypothetical protein
MLSLTWDRTLKEFKVTCTPCDLEQAYPYGYLDVKDPDRGNKHMQKVKAVKAWSAHFHHHDVGPVKVAAEKAVTRAYATKARGERYGAGGRSAIRTRGVE